MDQWELREKIALTSKILTMEGQSDFNLGHVSAVDEKGQVWMKPAKMGTEDITAGDTIAIDDSGNVLEGWHGVHGEYPIHTEIYRARPDIRCVVHTHPIHAIAFGARGEELRMLCHDAVPFLGCLAYFDETAELIATSELGERVAAVLGGKRSLLLRNHGIVTAGRTVEEALCLALHLERACRVALLAGEGAVPIDPVIALKMRDEFERSALQKYEGFFKYLIKKLIRMGFLQAGSILA